MSALWSGKPVSVRLDDLDKICAALGCTVADLLEAEPLADAATEIQQSDAAWYYSPATENTAIYYVHAAHPGRQWVIPR